MILTDDELPALPDRTVVTAVAPINKKNKIGSTQYVINIRHWTDADMRQAQRDTEAAVIAKIKAQGAAGWLRSGYITDAHGCWTDDRAVEKGWTPLYTLPGDTP